MVDLKKNLSGFDPLPTELVDSDVQHVNRGGKDYKAPASEYLKASDVLDDITNANATKPPSARLTNELYNRALWQNRASGLLFSFDSVWNIERTGTQVLVTVPKGAVVDINTGAKYTYSESTQETILDGGGIIATITGSAVAFSFLNDISTIVEAADLTKFVIAKNIGGQLKSRLATVEHYLYPTQQSITDLSWDFDASIVGADPTAGKFRMNNADPALVTEIYFSTESQQGLDVKEVLLGILPDSTLQIIQISSEVKSILCTAGVIVDNTTYITVPVTVIDNGSLFDTSAECSTSLYYEQQETASDITRNYSEVAVSGSSITIDFASKAEAWVTKSGGGGVVVDENISILLGNDGSKKTANLFISVTTLEREITLDASVKSNDSRWNDATDKLTLPVGNYLLRFNYSGAGSTYLEVMPEVYGSTAGRYGIIFKYEADTANTAPTADYMKFDNVDLSLVTRVNFSKTMQGVDISSLIANLSDGSEVIAYQADDTTKFISATVNGTPTDQTGYIEVLLTVNDSGTIFDVDSECSTNFDFEQASSGGGGHVIQEQIDSETKTSSIQRDNLLFKSRNGESIVSDDLANVTTVIEPKIGAQNDFDRSGENAGDVVVRNASDDGYEPQATAPDEKLYSGTPEANISANGLLSMIIPAGYKIENITITETAGNAAGNISIGSTALGTDIVNAQTVGASGDVLCTIVTPYFSRVNDTDLYISSSAWGTGVVTIYVTFIQV